jgi:cyanophycinase-like exopeptidase
MSLMGPIALHGGGEFLPGDERFLDELLDVAARAAEARTRAATWSIHDVAGHGFARERLRIAVLPTAASRGLPDRAAAVAVEAFEARARACGQSVRVDVGRVVDADSADDREVAEVIASADLVYLPGGDPDIVPDLLGPTAAGRALAAAHRRGAALAGASAGAMALADWAWTSRGGIRGLGFVHGLVVVPHYDDVRRMAWQKGLAKVAPPGIGYLGLDERTGVISDGGVWRVAGEGAAYWFVPGSSVPVVARHGERIDLPT